MVSRLGVRVDIDEDVGATLCGLRLANGPDLLSPGFRVAADLSPKSPFIDSGLRGWVDCFPSIAPGILRRDGSDVEIADHGDLWYRPWIVEHVDAETAALHCNVASLNILARKSVSWAGNGLHIRTAITNHGANALPFVWASHALFDIQPSDQLRLPRGLTEAFFYETFSDSAPLAKYWRSRRDGRRVWCDVSKGSMAKYFLEWPRSGVAFTSHGRPLHLEWLDAPRDAQLGIWINRGAFPAHPDSVSHLGIEPGLGRPDELEDAIQSGFSASIPGGGEVVMHLVLHVGGRGRPAPRASFPWAVH